MNELKEILAICVEHKLFSQEDADRILAENDRQFSHPIQIVISNGIDEKALYRAVSENFEIPLNDLENLKFDTEVLKVLSLEIADQFFCLPLLVENDCINLVTWNWTKIERITKAIKNITNKTVHLRLCTKSAFDKFRNKF